MNTTHPIIKFTFKYSKTSIDFLDTSIHIGQSGKLFSKVYIFPLFLLASRNKIINYLLTSA